MAPDRRTRPRSPRGRARGGHRTRRGWRYPGLPDTHRNARSSPPPARPGPDAGTATGTTLTGETCDHPWHEQGQGGACPQCEGERRDPQGEDAPSGTHGNEDPCPICQDAVGDTDPQWPGCGHRLHAVCLGGLRLRGPNPTCPMCRHSWPGGGTRTKSSKLTSGATASSSRVHHPQRGPRSQQEHLSDATRRSGKPCGHQERTSTGASHASVPKGSGPGCKPCAANATWGEDTRAGSKS